VPWRGPSWHPPWPSPCQERPASAPEQAGLVPYFEYDPTWPKPLPNNGFLGAVIGAHVDARDHVWIVHRSGGGGTGAPSAYQVAAAQTPKLAECCTPAPPVLAFDAAGTVVASWGGPGPGYEWPEGEHGIFVDHEDSVWIGSNGVAGQTAEGKSTKTDTHVLKFTRDGQFLLQIGTQGVVRGNDDTENMIEPTGMVVDPAAGEVFVSDGELLFHRRVIVFDAGTGMFKRMWGAYGNKPEDLKDLPRYKPGDPAPQQFRGPHCMRMDTDGLLYVCDRFNDRLQVFQKDGTFVREKFIAPDTLFPGSVYDIAFSPDPEQTYAYVADGMNKKVWILLRKTLEIVGRFGVGGNGGGQFNHPHSIATDSQGNLYVTETLEGKRVQRFLYKGLKAAQPIPE
jgi:hypothetical protein